MKYPKKLTWLKLDQIQQRPMEVDNTSSEFGADEQERFLQMNLSFILQSEIGSRIQSPENSDDE